MCPASNADRTISALNRTNTGKKLPPRSGQRSMARFSEAMRLEFQMRQGLFRRARRGDQAARRILWRRYRVRVIVP